MRIVFLFLTFLTAFDLHATGVRGRITDEKGQPLAFATIFVKENGSGAVANAAGEYEIRLDPGQYELTFQFMGYKTVVKTVAVGPVFTELNIAMEVQPIDLKPVGINLNGEDPAYTVMRKAIAKAGYHRQQLDSYQAQVYVKGSGRLINVPFYLRKTLKKEGIDSSMAFTLESVSQVEYKRPNTFKERVISIRTTGQDNQTSPMPYINGSFYQPEVAEAISPLSPKAFAYYKFQLESFFMDRGYGVNKIRVIPRSRGENIFEGYIYIVEDYWSIYSLSLGTYKFGIHFKIDQVYSPIEDKAWLPVSHKFEVDGKVLGFSFEYNYLASVKDYKIQLNPELAGQFDLVDEKLEKELAEQIKAQKKEAPAAVTPQERLASGQELTRKELRKLLTDYEKEEKNKEPEPEVVMATTFTVDSQAYRRDSLYWETIRPIPLTEQEVKGYRFQDSVAVKEATEQQKEDESEVEISSTGDEVRISASKKDGKYNPLRIITGDSHKLGKIQFSYDNMLTHLSFNPVEGFNIHNNITFRYPSKKPFTLTLTPRYAHERERFSL